MRWWAFTRRLERPPLRESWRVGDVAECIGSAWARGPERRPGAGDRAMVLSVRPGWSGGEPGWGLELLGWAGRWDANGFRKIDQSELPAEAQEEVECERV